MRYSRITLLIRALAAAAAVAALVGASASARPTGNVARGEPVKIGAMTILSGPTAIIGQETLRGTQFYAGMLNRKNGILGRPIEIIPADDQNNPTVAVQQAARLFQQDRVAGMVGPTATLPGVAIQKLQTDHKIIAVAYQSGGEALTASKNPYVFRSSVTLQTGFNLMVRYAVRVQKVKSFASFHWDLASGQSAHQGVEVGAREYGANLAFSQGLPLATTDFSSAIARARAANPQVVVIGAPMPFAGVLTKQIRAAGWNVPIYVWGGFVGTDYFTFAGKDANGVFVGDTGHWQRANQRKVGREFVTAFRREFGRPPNANELIGADALGILVGGMNRAKSLDADRVSPAIRRFGYNGIRLFYQWRPDGNLKSNPVVMARFSNGQLRMLAADVVKATTPKK